MSRDALLFVLACAGLQAFCAATEMAIVSADRIALRRRAADGGLSARLLEWFLTAPQRLLATTLLVSSLSVAASTVTVTSRLARRGFADPVLITLAVLSPLLLVFAELAPKTIARRHAEALAPYLVWPLALLAAITSPLLVVLTLITRGVTHVLGIGEPRALVTREELEAMLRGPGSGAIPEPERRLVQRIFRFRAQTVYDVMVPLSSVFALPEDTSFDDACREMQDKSHTRIPIYKERVDQVVGVVNAFDLHRTGARAGTVAEIARPPLFVPESAHAVEVLKQLQRARRSLAVVVDEYGGATGIVTVEDILEEVVGEIEDEFDAGEPESVRQEAPGVYRVRGRATLGSVASVAGVHLPEGEDYETVAGLLLDRLKRIPREGETVEIAGNVLTVTQASDRRVDEVRLQTAKAPRAPARPRTP